jgi:hypothetical protein
VSGADAKGRDLDDSANPPHVANMNFGANLKRGELMMLDQAKASGRTINYDVFVGYFYCPGAGLRQRQAGTCVVM